MSTSSFSNKSQPTARTLLIEAMILMIAVDGVVADEELLELARTVSGNPIFKGVNTDTIEKEFKRVLTALADEGLDARLVNLAKGLPDEASRMLAFAFATSICFSDGEMAPEELELLKSFQKVLGLKEERVALIITSVHEWGNLTEVLQKAGALTADPVLLTSQDALIEVMILMAAADGEIQQAEVVRLALTIATHPGFDSMAEIQIGEVIEAALLRVQTQGLSARLAELRMALPNAKDRSQALHFALSILVADGVAALSEMMHLEQMRVAFEIDQATFDVLKRQFIV